MARRRSTWRQCEPVRTSTRWQPALSGSQQRGVKSSPSVSQKLERLKVIVAERADWETSLAQVKGMHQWVLDVEHILNGSWAAAGEVVSNETVRKRLDAWREQMEKQLADS